MHSYHVMVLSSPNLQSYVYEKNTWRRIEEYLFHLIEMLFWIIVKEDWRFADDNNLASIFYKHQENTFKYYIIDFENPKVGCKILATILFLTEITVAASTGDKW